MYIYMYVLELSSEFYPVAYPTLEVHICITILVLTHFLCHTHMSPMLALTPTHSLLLYNLFCSWARIAIDVYMHWCFLKTLSLRIGQDTFFLLQLIYFYICKNWNFFINLLSFLQVINWSRVQLINFFNSICFQWIFDFSYNFWKYFKSS